MIGKSHLFLTVFALGLYIYYVLLNQNAGFGQKLNNVRPKFKVANSEGADNNTSITTEEDETDAAKIEQLSTTKTNVIKILLWTECRGGQICVPSGTAPFVKCPVSHCDVTYNRSQIQQADALMFHRNIKRSKAGIPPYRSPHQVWIYWNAEAPTPFNSYPRLKDAFNFTMTTRLDSDMHTFHGFYNIHPDPPKVLPDYSKGRWKLVAWVVSHHCKSSSRREAYVQRLQEHIPVDIYGGCGNLTCPGPDKSTCFLFIGSTYKFYLALENHDCRDYVTEKVWRNSFDNNLVPIVRGYYNNFKSILPHGSYIHTNEFPNPKALAMYLIYLDNNNTAYNEYFKWKLRYVHTRASSRHWSCELCRVLHETKGKVKEYKDMWDDFYSFEKNCYNYAGIAIDKFDK